MTTVLALWRCLCSDVQESGDALPECCPTHGRPRAAEPVPQRPGKPMRLGHQCGPRRCADHRNPAPTDPTTKATAPEEQA